MGNGHWEQAVVRQISGNRHKGVVHYSNNCEAVVGESSINCHVELDSFQVVQSSNFFL